MPAGISKDGQTIMNIVEENPGSMTRSQIIEMFEPEKSRSISVSLGRLLGTQSQKLYEDDKGKIWPSGHSDHNAEVNLVQDDKDASMLMTMPYAYQEPIELPSNAISRSLEVIFEVTLRVKKARRFGISNATNKHAVIWLPPGSNVLRVQLGQYKPNSGTELMAGNYLCIVTKSDDPNNGFVVRYYASPQGERFALSWDEE